MPQLDKKDTFIIALLIFLIVIFLYESAGGTADRFEIDETIHVKSSIDGMTYKVHASHENPQIAADMMAELYRRTLLLLRRLRDKYVKKGNNSMDPDRTNPYRTAREIAVDKILSRYNPDNLVENSPFNSENDTSYTIDKGAIVAMCMRSSTDGKLHDINTLMFVKLHELAHIAIEENEHPPIFWRTFKFILMEASSIGIYIPIDYSKKPVYYCRMYIEDNPLLDSAVSAIE